VVLAMLPPLRSTVRGVTTRENSWLDPTIARYIDAHAAPPDDLQRELIAETAEATGSAAGMQIGSDQGALMGLLVRLTGARRAVEVGTFTGYSSLAIARALPDDGTLLCCDVSEEWTSIAGRYWERAGVAGKVELKIGPALETLQALPRDEPIDLAFIDADKPAYRQYYEELLPRLRQNGLILLDNTLWSGRVAGEADPSDANTTALQELNDFIAGDDRVESYILPVGDGVTLVRKR
jgi:caffeoyl-CoA O-methyltransferase